MLTHRVYRSEVVMGESVFERDRPAGAGRDDRTGDVAAGFFDQVGLGADHVQRFMK